MTTFPFISGQNKHWGEHIYICWLRNGEQMFNILILNQHSNFCETLLTASTCKIDPDLQELPFSSIHKIRPWKGHSIWSLCFEYLDTYEIIASNQFCKTVQYVMVEDNVNMLRSCKGHFPIIYELPRKALWVSDTKDTLWWHWSSK